MKLITRMVLWVSLLAAVGCGYTATNEIYNTDNIFIAPVTNDIKITGEGRLYSNYKSYPRLVENELTNALVRRFNINGNLAALSPRPGQLKLSCSVIDYDKVTLQYADEDKGETENEVKEQRLNLKVHIKLEDENGKIIKENDISGTTSFYLYGPYAKAEDTAWLDLVDDTSRRVAEAVLENW